MQQRNSEAWWRRTTAMLLSVSFGTYRRRHRHVLMGRQRYVPLKRLGDIPLRRHWMFHLRLIWDVKETPWWDVVVTPSWDISWRFNKMSWRSTTEMSLRRSTKTSLGASFETYLRRCWDVQRDVVTTSLRRLVAGCLLDKSLRVLQIPTHLSNLTVNR